MKVVIVGAGGNGLVSLVNFQRLFSPEELEFVCYERRQQVGGEWIDMKDQPETYDQNGLPMRTTVYDGLQMSSPNLLYPIYPDHKFPEGTKLFPYRADMYNYLKSLSDRYNLEQYIKFNKTVSDISFNKETSQFSMKIHDLKSEDVIDETCDYLLMCIGNFTLPRKIDIDMSKFKAEWFHYHDLRDPKRMYGKRILVVGSSWGAIDMAILLNKPGRAKTLHMCYRNKRPLCEGSANLTSVHEWIISAEGNTVYFKDGSSVEVDAVIFCHGFTPFYPLNGDLQLNFEETNISRFLPPLYKALVHPKCPKLFFIGKSAINAMSLAHPQSILISKIIKGEFSLPSQEDMEADISKSNEYWSRELTQPRAEKELDTYFPLLDQQLAVGNFPHEMCSDVPRIGCDDMHELYYQIFSALRKDCLNYKSYAHEFRPDPKNPKRMITYLIPDKSKKPIDMGFTSYSEEPVNNSNVNDVIKQLLPFSSN